MSDQTGASEYVIGGAGLAVGSTSHSFDHSYPPRDFQAQALDWIHGDDTPPVAAVCAPTGGGKTDVITALAGGSEQTLCVYPTNALIDAQADAIADAGYTVKEVTGDTLTGSGAERSNQLLKIAQNRHHDVIITNPDVLQAVIQDSYFSPGSRIMEIFAQFDAAVYDEFHYYDPLAASGLLTQIKIFSERGEYRAEDGSKALPKFLLTSATPDETFVDIIEDDLQLDVETIRATVRGLDVSDTTSRPIDTDLIYYRTDATGETALADQRLAEVSSKREAFEVGITADTTADESISRFRHPMYVHRTQEWIGDCFDRVADQLDETIETAYDGGGPVAAVIFNSAARSNAFQQYLADHRPDLASKITKDNGYDTNAGRSMPDATAGVNTTSKGEVGLNYDLKRLVMAAPHTASQFIQRIGRAARQSPAVINLYGLKDPNWPVEQSYPQFLARVADTPAFASITHQRERLQHMTGLRAATALDSRLSGDQYHNEAVFEDFKNFPRQSEWSAFLSDLDADIPRAKESGWDGLSLDGPDASTADLDAASKQLIRALETITTGLNSLRGQTLSYPVIYPRDGTTEQTEYDLISALSHYAVGNPSELDADSPVQLVDGGTGSLVGYYTSKPNGGDGIDLTQSQQGVETELTEGYLRLLEQAETDLLQTNAAQIKRFLRGMPLASAMVPERIVADDVAIGCDTSGYPAVTEFSLV